MDLPLDVEVHCSDGRHGRSTHVILNPATEKITHLVVRERRPSRVARLVPVSWIANSTPDVILLNQPKEAFDQLEPFSQTDFIYKDVPHYATDPKVTFMWPYVVPARRMVEATHRRVAPGELVVRRGAKVRATDGRVGKVDEFIVDASDGTITHLVLRERYLLSQREVAVPLSHISLIEEGVIHLGLSKKEVEALPAISVRRRW
jgi:sporulation protein YlmC with PRC-barrel domain